MLTDTQIEERLTALAEGDSNDNEIDTLRDIVTDLQAERRRAAADASLALWLTPDALRDAFDGYDDECEAFVKNASDEELRKIGQEVLDCIYDEYRRLLDGLVNEAMGNTTEW